jgi:MFS family permease
MATTITAEQAPPPIKAKGGIWGRQLDRYPANGPRSFYLGVVIIVTIMLYYELYVGGSVATKISQDLHMTLTFLITVAIVGNALGVFAALFAGLADRWGRANLIVYGLAITGVLVYCISFVHSKVWYLVLVGIIGLVEGVILVATPALIRDFSPQLGRASAMGFWTLGPVMGSLVVTEVSSHTLDAHPDWQYQFRICGVVGIAVFVLAFFGLRELAPALRDQLMVSLRDKVLIETKARGIDPGKLLDHQFRQMRRWDIIGPSFGIGVFLLFYYIAVGLFVVFFVTNYGFSLAKANDLGNWYWSVQAVALIVTGILSDWLKVRKPFMIIGSIISGIGVAMFAMFTTDPTAGTQAGYNHWILCILLISVGGAIAFAAWMAAFTETVEKHNPAATATGLAVWAATLRVVVVAALIGLIFAIPAASTLVDKGGQMQAYAGGVSPNLNASQNAVVAAVVADKTIVPTVQKTFAAHGPALTAAKNLDAATLAALATNPADPVALPKALSEMSGLPLDTVNRVLLDTQVKYKDEFATAITLGTDLTTALLTNPGPDTTKAAIAKLKAADPTLTDAQAGAKLVALGKVPTEELLFVGANGPAVQKAGNQLTELATIPPADLATVTKYGPGLTDPAVVAALTYLQDNLATVTQAQQDSPKQWQMWWWICLGGQVLFIPFIWLLTGRWSPRKAREDAKAHEDAVNRELATLAAGPTAATAAA